MLFFVVGNEGGKDACAKFINGIGKGNGSIVGDWYWVIFFV